MTSLPPVSSQGTSIPPIADMLISREGIEQSAMRVQFGGINRRPGNGDPMIMAARHPFGFGLCAGCPADGEAFVGINRISL